MRLIPFALLLPLALSSYAQTPAPTTQSAADAAAAAQLQKTVDEAKSAGVALTTSSNVQQSVNIEAVMLPSSIVKSVFGKEVANNYAVIEVNVANRNPGSSFILQSLYIDYSQWGLANGMIGFNPYINPKGYTSNGDSSNVSSVEYRVIRGEVLDRQAYTGRNLAIRSMKVLGTIGTAFAFPFSTDVVKGIGAWNGAVVPGFDELFPDPIQNQLNRISDFGFRNNKVIPQQSADIVIAFFPVKRFLTPTLAKAFRDNPALFFNPLLLALDPATQPKLRKLMVNALDSEDNVKSAFQGVLKMMGTGEVAQLSIQATRLQTAQAKVMADGKRLQSENATLAKLTDENSRTTQNALISKLTDAMNTDEKELKDAQTAITAKFKAEGNEEAFRLYSFLSQISLSKVAIVVSGIMSVDEQIVPSSITESCFDKPDAAFWGTPGDKTCAIRGKFLLHGLPKIVNSTPSDLGITAITVKDAASSSDLLTFTFNLAKAIAPPKFSLIVTKQGSAQTSVDSMAYPVSATVTMSPPTIADVTSDGTGDQTKVIVTGANFFDVKPDHALTVSLKPATGAVAALDPFTLDSPTQLTLPATTLQNANAGCYAIMVKAGTADVTSTRMVKVVAGTPKAISVADSCN